MAMILSPNTETLLLTIASQRGVSPEEALNAVLLEAESEFRAAVADVHASQEDFTSGRSLSLEEYREQATVRRPLRVAASQSAEVQPDAG